ncbi:MAG: 30S ribosomal protein S9 [Patescibacteria group bacterium]|jgi:small subunit ribosomal protein S9|nr:30S ribosomal protein S9 [Patescibacteria group bacterium]
MADKKVKKYFEAVGRRKTSIARVRITEEKKDNKIIINGKDKAEYLNSPEFVEIVTSPLRATGTEEAVSISIKAIGGGIRGQAEAIRLGISRALIKLNEDFNQTLRDLDYLKRDPRRKERKKPGLKKARKSPQWAKR